MARSGCRSAVTVAIITTVTVATHAPAFADAPQSLYYVQRGAPACQHVQALEKVPALWRATPDSHAKDFAALDCSWLQPNTEVMWDGVRRQFYFARITAAGRRPLVMYANDLDRSRYRDPLRRDFATRDGAIACGAPFRLPEASQAVAQGDSAWLRETGCIRLPAGVSVLRISPAVAAPGVWQVRIHDRTSETVWMRSTDLVDAP